MYSTSKQAQDSCAMRRSRWGGEKDTSVSPMSLSPCIAFAHLRLPAWLLAWLPAPSSPACAHRLTAGAIVQHIVGKDVAVDAEVVGADLAGVPPRLADITCGVEFGRDMAAGLFRALLVLGVAPLGVLGVRGPPPVAVLATGRCRRLVGRRDSGERREASAAGWFGSCGVACLGAADDPPVAQREEVVVGAC